MNNRWYAVVSAAIMTISAGCAEERIPSEEADAWEVAAPAATEGTPAGESSSRTTPTEGTPAADNTPVADGAVAVLKGSAFSIEGRPGDDSGDVFARSHYFKATAPLELNSTVTLIETDIEGQNRNGAVPIVGLIVQKPNGEQAFANIGRPIDGQQLLKDKVEIGPGNYTVVMTYYKDTVGEMRPQITLRTMAFRK